MDSEAKQRKSDSGAQLDLRLGKSAVKKIGGKRITVTRVKPKTHRGAVSVVITVEDEKTC